MKKVLVFGLFLAVAGYLMGGEVFSLPYLELGIASAIVLVGGWIMGAAIIHLAETNPVIRSALRGNWNMGHDEEGGEE